MTKSSQPLFLPQAPALDTAWLFPGQGAQAVGMGRDLYERSPAAKFVFDTADRVLGVDLSQICFEGPEERLRDTEFAQPAILTASLATLAATQEAGKLAGRPAFVAGHSLGEYSALVAAAGLTLEHGLSLLRQRAVSMAEASRTQAGTLAALVGLDQPLVESLCEEADVDICNLNLENQIVVGGVRENVLAAIELAKQRGAQRALELNVSGAFHSRLMSPAKPELIKAIEAAHVADSSVTLVANASAMPVHSAADIREELQVQVDSPVRWHQSVTLMAANGVSTFIEFGPGRVLTGLAKRLVPSATLVNIGTYEDIEAL